MAEFGIYWGTVVIMTEFVIGTGGFSGVTVGEAWSAFLTRDGRLYKAYRLYV
jgi:hypothetical protein